MINGTPEPFAVFFDYYGACQSYHYGITNFLGCLSTLVMSLFPCVCVVFVFAGMVEGAFLHAVLPE